MKLKHALILLVLGYCVNFVGALLKILHRENADTLFITATFLEILGMLLLLYKILTHPKVKEFLDW